MFYEGDACESVPYLAESEIKILVGARDYAKAAKLYGKACELKSPIGCAFLGAFYRDGRGVEQSYEKAAEIFTKACEIDSGNGCYDLAELHEGGLGVRQDIKKRR
ncbi:tetratricopeptide repeat protein [Campylobacter rectus]|uniref:tetratricopeptide repeat protein n=1 Tax=Campylobacter rectus TaxID=203 RepID=UPI0023F0F51C|nr:tetratricopeptide repeat protein [Campylobacter rectus]